MPPRRIRTAYSQSPAELLPISRLWMLRLLVPLGGWSEFLCHHGFDNDRCAELLGLGEWVNFKERDFDPKAIRAELNMLHRKAECTIANAELPPQLSSNVANLARLVGLSANECRILEFAIMIKNDRILSDATDWLGQISTARLFTGLSILLDISEHEVRTALSTQSVLAKSGLVSVDRNGVSSLSNKIDMLSQDFADTIYSSDPDPVTLLRETVALGAAPELSLSDYEHIDATLAVLRPYLKTSVDNKGKGVNVFLYGAPGTGKTQLARLLAQELNCELFEVSSEDIDGDPVAGSKRLRAFRAAQSFFSRRRALMLFDEAEDVFNDGAGLFDKGTAQTRKAWINRMLEDNTVPTLWLSNSIDMDPAFVRRFDIVCELPVPPRKQRERILTEVCAGLVDTATIARICASETLAPAVVTRAAAVVRRISEELNDADRVSAFNLLINNTLEAQGHARIKRHDANQLPEVYDPLFIHADADLAQIAGGLIACKAGRLCLYGPSGTGKTAYARWLAEQMNIPLLVKRASDLMSPYLGVAEKNIARAFTQAEHEGALLLIDEVDSFLQDRRGAQRSWEVSQVNEMLTQMEAFSGLFIASTNLMAGLDQAALRRFDLKVKFDYLQTTQAQELLRRYCATLALAAPERECLVRLSTLLNVTPGDFAAVARQGRFRPVLSAAQFVTALEGECGVKEGVKAGMGFVH